MTYASHLLNVTASPTLGGITPLQALTGQVPEMSFLLHFTFWEPVYYKVDQSEPGSHLSSHSNEKHDHWIGFAGETRDQFTWKILIDDTQKIFIQSSVCCATRTSTNKRLALPHEEGQMTDITSNSFVDDATSPHEESGLLSTLNFDDLLGRTFLIPAQENGECKQAHTIEHVTHLEDSQVSNRNTSKSKG